MTDVFLVGDEKSEKTNQWLMVTPSLEDAQKYMDEEPTALVVKRITVKERPTGGRRKKR